MNNAAPPGPRGPKERQWSASGVVLLVLGLGWLPAAQGTTVCLICHNNPSFAVREASGQVRSLFVDPERFYQSRHGSLECVDCHANFPTDPHAAARVRSQETLPHPAFLARVTHRNKAAVWACLHCHPQEFEDYRESVHGQAVVQGDPDAPLCTDCHGWHYIPPVSSPESAVRNLNVPATCAQCHTDALVMAQHNVQTQVVETFSASFHGKKLALGSQQAPACSSCHGAHGIYRPSDPRSQVFSANRPHTCGQTGCHPGADETFAQGFSHSLPSPQQEPLVYWVGRLYVGLILATIGGMGLYILLDLTRRVRNAFPRNPEE